MRVLTGVTPGNTRVVMVGFGIILMILVSVGSGVRKNETVDTCVGEINSVEIAVGVDLNRNVFVAVGECG